MVKNTEQTTQKQERKAEKLEQKVKKLVENSEPEARKIGQLLDLCCELIPAPIAKRIRDDYQKHVLNKVYGVQIEDALNSQLLSVLFLNITYKGYKGNEDREFHWVDPPEWAINDHSIEKHERGFLPWFVQKSSVPRLYRDLIVWNISSLSENIKQRRKNKCYTDALVEIIYSLINIRYWVEIDFKNFAFIGELLIEMGSIGSALKLYTIDDRVFNKSNVLELLVNSAIKSGDLETSNKLIGKLIEQESYHPSISILQAEIKRLEQRHHLKARFSIDFSTMNELSGVEFENLLMDKFVAMGFKVESTPKSGDFGADLIVENNEGSRIVVQCKRFKSRVNLQAVQEVVGAMGHYAGDMGIVITNNSFLNSAIKLAESHDIELWDGDKLVSFLASDLSFSQVFS